MEKKKKPIVQAKDEFELLKILHLPVKMIFDHEQYCVQLALLMQLVVITGNWLRALLGIRYNNIKITLLLDLQRRKFSWRLIEIAFKNIKGKKKIFVFLSTAFSSYEVIWLDY